MSKTTKIIAALGVAAGLGVAALPAFTFADGPSVNGNVQIDVEVQPAIAMTISGNNDSGTTSYADTYTVAETVVGTTDVTGMYEWDSTNSEYIATEDTTALEGKTYYNAPVAPTYGTAKVAAPAGATTIDGQDLSNFTKGASGVTAALTSSSFLQILPNQAIEGDRSAQTPSNDFGSTITVYTNAASGYTLSVKDADNVTSLMHTSGNYSIPTGADAVVAGTAKWNFDSTTVTSSYADKTAQAMPANSGTAVVIDQTDAKTNNGSTTIVDYNVATAGDQATGIYTDTIVYTATCN